MNVSHARTEQTKFRREMDRDRAAQKRQSCSGKGS